MPQGLQDKVFIDIMAYFANRGRENLRDIKITDFVIQENEEGLQYIVHRDVLTKSGCEKDNEGYSAICAKSLVQKMSCFFVP